MLYQVFAIYYIYSCSLLLYCILDSMEDLFTVTELSNKKNNIKKIITAHRMYRECAFDKCEKNGKKTLHVCTRLQYILVVQSYPDPSLLKKNNQHLQVSDHHNFTIL